MVPPEEEARKQIDIKLVESGWIVQDREEMNLFAGKGVAVREFGLAEGFSDYLLFIDQSAVGVLEAKPEGHTLSGVEIQTGGYARGRATATEDP
jgi:type I restriction enzyme, R subunit